MLVLIHAVSLAGPVFPCKARTETGSAPLGTADKTEHSDATSDASLDTAARASLDHFLYGARNVVDQCKANKDTHGVKDTVNTGRPQGSLHEGAFSGMCIFMPQCGRHIHACSERIDYEVRIDHV